jgi:hypothetical protein
MFISPVSNISFLFYMSYFKTIRNLFIEDARLAYGPKSSPTLDLRILSNASAMVDLITGKSSGALALQSEQLNGVSARLEWNVGNPNNLFLSAGLNTSGLNINAIRLVKYGDKYQADLQLDFWFYLHIRGSGLLFRPRFVKMQAHANGRLLVASPYKW